MIKVSGASQADMVDILNAITFSSDPEYIKMDFAFDGTMWKKFKQIFSKL